MMEGAHPPIDQKYKSPKVGSTNSVKINSKTIGALKMMVK